MPAKSSRRLVIDASVAGSAGGGESTFPTSKHCRDFLRAVLAVCHRIIMTREVADEWKAHQSNFSSQWRVSMAARKKVLRLANTPDAGLHAQIQRIAPNQKDAEAMLKDSHLITAALITDRTVISLDETARGLFALTARRVGALKNIVWVNPAHVEEQPIVWLERGATPEKERLLRFRTGGRS